MMKIYTLIKANIILPILIFLLFSCSGKNNTVKEAVTLHNQAMHLHDSLEKAVPELNILKSQLLIAKDSLKGSDTLDKIKYVGLVSDIENVKEDLNEWEESIIEVPGNEHQHGYGSGHEHHHHEAKPDLTDEQILNIQKSAIDQIFKIKKDLNEINLRSVKLLKTNYHIIKKYN